MSFSTRFLFYPSVLKTEHVLIAELKVPLSRHLKVKTGLPSWSSGYESTAEGMGLVPEQPDKVLHGTAKRKRKTIS